MDAQDFRSLQEAYLDVYQLDEAEGSYGQTPKADAAYTKLATAKGKSSKTKSLALKHAVRSAADSYNSDEPYSHRSNMTQSDRDYHRGQSENRGGDREGIAYHRFDTGASGPGGKPKGKKLERQRKTGVSAESYDIYDIILSHLLDEGYADTEQAAEAIMVNMSEEWRESIVDEILDEANRGDQYATRGMSSGDAIAHKISRRNARSGYNPDERGGSRQPTTGPSMDSPSGPIAGGTRSRRDLTARNRGKRNRMAPDPQSTTGRIQHTSGGPKGGTKDPEVVGTNKYLRLQNFKRNPPKRTTSYYDN